MSKRQEALKDELALAQVDYLVRLSPMMAIVSTINAVLVAVVFHPAVPNTLLFPWLALCAGMSAYQFVRRLRFRARPWSIEATPSLLRRATLWAGFLGSIWGLAGLLFFPGGDIMQRTFLAFVIGGMCAGSVASVSAIPRVCAAYMLPALAPITIAFLSVPEETHRVMGLMLLVFGSALAYASRQGYRQFYQVVRVQQELDKVRLDLMDAIDSTSEAFALYDENGAVIIQNDRFRDLFEGMPPQLEESLGEAREHRTPSGRWLQSSVRRTARGGYVSVHADITNLKRREEEIRRARDEATSASRTKTEFLALMSHELRTPLNAILGFSQILRSKELSHEFGDRVFDYAADIHASGEHLLAMINDILDLSKIEAGLYKLHDEAIEVGEIVRSMREQFATAAEANGLNLTTDVDAGLPRLLADEKTLRRMLSHLLSNAVKFTPEGGRVGISARNDRGEIVIAVRDTGIGIAAQDMDRVYEPFRQVEGSLARHKEGTGLGVPLSRRLMMLQGGTLILESEVGKGTTASLRFPCSRTLPEGAAASSHAA